MDMEPSPKQQAENNKNLGNEEFKKGNYTKALEFYNKAINLNNEDASYYANRAACYL